MWCPPSLGKLVSNIKWANRKEQNKSVEIAGFILSLYLSSFLNTAEAKSCTCAAITPF